MTHPSNADLREAKDAGLIVSETILHTSGVIKKYHNPAIHPPEMQQELNAIYHEARADFQAREQQMITELLGEAKEYEKWVGGNQATGRAITVEAVPVSVIERLQNKTNDGGS